MTLSDAQADIVFPTHVGVFLGDYHGDPVDVCLPHARGGVSATTSSSSPLRLSSPRTWGCFYTQLFDAKAQEVFPTHVGVFLLGSFLLMFARRLPHARGGVSWLTYAVMLLVGSSPRTWGCFRCMPPILRKHYVFPTHVGVFPMTTLPTSLRWRLPHARGGVSSSSS